MRSWDSGCATRGGTPASCFGVSYASVGSSQLGDREEWCVRDGQPDGPYIYTSGQRELEESPVVESGTLRDGKPVGLWHYWNADGRLAETREHAEGGDAMGELVCSSSFVWHVFPPGPLRWRWVRRSR